MSATPAYPRRELAREDAGDLARYEPQLGCQAYAGYVAWLALNGAPGDVAVAQASLGAGEPPELARRYARLIQAYELEFWNTLAEGIPETA